MSKQKDLTPIRRCLGCNYKTHRMKWKEKKWCPVCGLATGFRDSTHDGLSEEEIREARGALKITLRETQPSENEQQPFFPSKERR